MSSTPDRALTIPVEIQVRELDSKLLLACVAAQRGFESIVGYRTDVDFRIASLPRSTYLSKSMTGRSTKMFSILRSLGHEVGVWDEEALVYPSQEHYFSRRMSVEALAHVSLLFAWGEDNAELFRKFPGYSGAPIHVTGHPRIDLLRPELRDFFQDGVRRIRERHGRFVLVNTNFSKFNARRDPGGGRRAQTRDGRRKRNKARLSADYVAHKGALFEAFREMVPALAASFPDHRFVVRPHPNELREPWRAAAASYANVDVEDEGNVIPWLLAADAIVHNGCTTAIEAFALGRPAVAYRPVKADAHDHEFPNALSHEAVDLVELRAILARAVAGELACRAPSGRPRPFDEFVTGLDGRLAADRIVDVLEERAARRSGPPRTSAAEYLRGWSAANRRRFDRRGGTFRLTRSRADRERDRIRFPDISAQELRERIARFDACLGRFGGVRVETVADRIFRIDAAS